MLFNSGRLIYGTSAVRMSREPVFSGYQLLHCRPGAFECAGRGGWTDYLLKTFSGLVYTGYLER